jgi:hypothetical protein
MPHRGDHRLLTRDLIRRLRSQAMAMLPAQRIVAVLRDAVLRRRMWLVAAGAFVLLSGLATVVATPIILSGSSASLADRIAEIGDIFAGSSLLLTIAGALIALRAYAVSTGLPNLEVIFEFSPPDQPVSKVVLDKNDPSEKAQAVGTESTISLRNTSGYLAKNLAVIVLLQKMAVYGGSTKLKEEGWVANELVDDGGITVLQWEGGPEFSIYGHSVRRLPRLDLSGLRETSTTTPSLDLEIPGGAASSFSRRARKALNKPGPKVFIEIFAEHYKQISWYSAEFAAAEATPAEDNQEVGT